MMFDLSGRTAFVTGASGGIGGAIARALAEQGAQVALGGTKQAALEALAGELAGKGHVVAADISDRAKTDAAFIAAEAALGGKIDILVNNAGITSDQLALRMKDEDWDRVLEINLTASFRLTRAALRGMMKRRWGRIIGITSVVGATGNPGQANYAASKAGMIGMTKAIAAEVASRGITVNCVAPGFIDTAMTAVLTEEQNQRIAGNVPAGRLGSAAEIAAAVVYFSSEESAYVTGATLHVNGGLAML
jgi:3-oxoacyl-[acyl-carrier protein] reductase